MYNIARNYTSYCLEIIYIYFCLKKNKTQTKDKNIPHYSSSFMLLHADLPDLLLKAVCPSLFYL